MNENVLPNDTATIAEAARIYHVHWLTVKSMAEKRTIRSWSRANSPIILVSLSEVGNNLKWELRGGHEKMDA